MRTTYHPFARHISLVSSCILFLSIVHVVAQEQPSLSFTVGVEQDVLPYITGGYFAGVWVGKGHLRGRALLARVHKPDLIIPDGFTNNWVTAYALVGDYFLKTNWQGWWISSGLVFWDSRIQSDERLDTAHYQNTLLNGSLGYNWKFFRHFYLSPWAGLHLRIGGDQQVTTGGKTFKPPLLNPEASLKLGWHF